MREVELHITDIQQFIQCRQRWYWQSPLGLNLQPAGTPPALFLGQGVHMALDKYYQMSWPREIDPAIEAFKRWCLMRASRIEEHTGRLWPQERTMINDMYALGDVMLRHYHLWSHLRDEFYKVVGTEDKFHVDVPILDDWPWGDIHLTFAGRIDGRIRDVRTGKLYLLEFKTIGRITNARWIMRSLQSPAYAWAASEEEEVTGVIFRFLWKKPPQTLKWLTSSERFSIAKSQKTSYEWARRDIEQFAIGNNLDPLETVKQYRGFLLSLNEGGNKYFEEYIIPRTRAQMNNAIRAVYAYGKIMSDPNVLVFPRGGYHCSYCPFADVCALKEQGMDYQGLLDAEYNTREYWENQ